MKQLGNLAVVCAKRDDVLMQIQAQMVAVHVGDGPERRTLTAQWDDDEAIRDIVYELNFDQASKSRKERKLT